jgi:hypothetical protein
MSSSKGCFAGFDGGGISVETASRATITDCIFTGNRAQRGGGFACGAEATLRGCLIADNRSLEWGGGVEIFYPGRASFERTIVWGNCAQDGAGQIHLDVDTTLDFACSLYDPNDVVLLGTGTVTNSGANVSTAPNFCYPLACASAPIVGGDYHLQAVSPALAASSPCGERIGPFDAACSAQTPVVPLSWSEIKRIYGR